MACRTDIDEGSLTSLDRAWRGATNGIMWPLAIGDALHPMDSMVAWARAGARDPRCLWWILARFGAEAMADASDHLDADRKCHVISWMCEQAQCVWVEDQPVENVAGWRFRLDPSGARIWEHGGVM